MPLSTAAKAALCLCPPVAMAGAVATVPPVKRAVHHLTADHHPRPVRRVATAAAKPPVKAIRQADCLPVPAEVPSVPLVTYAAPIPPEPSAEQPLASTAGPAGNPVQPGIGVLAAEAPAPVNGGMPTTGTTGDTPPTTVTPTPTPTPEPGAVPEPATWLMLILGIGTVGVSLRRRRRRSDAVTADGQRSGGATPAMWGASAAAGAGDVATSVAVKSTVASAAAKALLCACPAAVVAGSVVAVPPLRHAVHAATTPATPLVSGPVASAVPCNPATVPVSAASVKGYPDVVTTVAAGRPLNGTASQPVSRVAAAATMAPAIDPQAAAPTT